MPLTKLQFRPGINREVTAYTNEGGWVDCNKIRFRAGSPETIGGWVRQSDSQFLGVARGLINWTTLTGSNLLGIGTHLKYYIDRGGTLNDITPIRLTTAAGDATFAATDGSDVLVVSNTAHGARLGDFVTFTDAVSLGGNVTADVLNAEHQITDIVDADSYEITLSTPATIRTNLLTFSEQFDNVAWEKFKGTITANTTVAPDGNTTADSFIEDATLGEHYVDRSFSVVAGTTYTFSTHVKQFSGTRNFLLRTAVNAGINAVNLNLSTGVFTTIGTTGSLVSSGVVPLPNGWFRVSITVTATGTGTGIFRQQLTDGVTTIYTGDNTSGVSLWGAQLEEGSLTDYIPTTTAAVTVGDTGDGGAGTIAAYQINVGLATSFRGDGWGADAWGVGGWGAAADTSIPGESLRLWSHTTFGEDLIINPRGQGLYYWDLTSGLTARAVDISTLSGADEVPVEVNIVKLSEQDRHVMAFGCTPLGGGDLDPLLIRFSSQESVLDWSPSPTNTAGDLRISSGNQIIAVQQTSQQMVILTDASLHTTQFIGPPFTFGIREVANGISTAGPNCAIAANDTVYWMGLGEFYMYDGTVREIPCSVKEYVFDQTFDSERRDIVFAAHNSSFSEIWWFYPCTTSGDCTRYVVYNYAQENWYYGTLPRTAWIDRGTSLNPIAAGVDGFIYSHESGLNDGSTNPVSALNAYIQSSPVDMGDGEQFMFASRMIPDLTFRSSTGSPVATITLTAQNFPGGAFFGDQPSPVARSVSVPVEQFTQQNFIRLRGRAVALRIESSRVGTQWRLGSPRLDLRTDGRR